MLGPETVSFLNDLSANNTRDWLTENKQRYESNWKQAGAQFAESFALALEEALGQSMRAKVYRLHRDLRFSKDKTPYHTHLHISATPDEASGAAPAFMFGLDANKLSVGVGLFAFDKAGLTTWRKAAASNAHPVLSEVQTLVRTGFRLNPPELKRVPPGFAVDHPNAEHLRRKSLHVWFDTEDVSLCFGEKGPSAIVGKAEQFIPLFQALGDLS